MPCQLSGYCVIGPHFAQQNCMPLQFACVLFFLGSFLIIFLVNHILASVDSLLSIPWTSPYNRGLNPCRNLLYKEPIYNILFELPLEIHGLLQCDDSKQGTWFFWESNCLSRIWMTSLVCGPGFVVLSALLSKKLFFFIIIIHWSSIRNQYLAETLQKASTFSQIRPLHAD